MEKPRLQARPEAPLKLVLCQPQVQAPRQATIPLLVLVGKLAKTDPVMWELGYRWALEALMEKAHPLHVVDAVHLTAFHACKYMSMVLKTRLHD
eukprot:3892726-Amphidinium_carterae.1